MTRLGPPLLLVATAVVITTAGCPLPPYPSGEITCDPGNTDAPCPDGYACLDLRRDGREVCVAVGCGDGVVNTNIDPRTGIVEACDDANDNDLDLCDSSCRQTSILPRVELGLGRGEGAPLATDLGQPGSIAVDRSGNALVASFTTSVITRLDSAGGTITPFAGNGSIVNVGGAVVQPNEIALPFVGGLAVDGEGNVFIADLFENVVRRIDGVTGVATVVVPNRPNNVDLGVEVQDSPSTALPHGVAVDGNGTLYFVDLDDPVASVRRIRRVDPDTGRMETVHDGFLGPLSLGLGDVDFDEAGVLYSLAVGDPPEFLNGRRPGILVVDPSGFSRIISLPPPCLDVQNTQRKLAVSPDGTVVFYASGASILRVTLDAAAGRADCSEHAVLPVGESPTLPIYDDVAEAGALDLAWQTTPDGSFLLAPDPTTGIVWRIHVDQPGVFEPWLGIGFESSPGDEDLGILVRETILNLAVATDGRVTINETTQCSAVLPPPDADEDSRLKRSNFEVFAAFPDQHKVVHISCFDGIRFIAGSGVAGNDDGDGDPARAALNNPVAAIRAGDQNIYIADRDNNAIRKLTTVDESGETLARETFSTFIRDGEPVAGAPLLRPSGLATDGSGQLLIADAGNGRLVRVDPVTGEASVLIDELAEPGALVFLPYVYVETLIGFAPGCNVPVGTLAPEACGVVAIVERSGHRIRAEMLPPLSGSYVLAGTPDGEEPRAGDRDEVVENGSTRSELRFPRGLMIDVPNIPTGEASEGLSVNLLIVDAVDRLRSLSLIPGGSIAAPLLTSVATMTALDEDGLGLPAADDALVREGRLRGPRAMVALDADRLLILERVSGHIRALTRSTGRLVTVTGLPSGARLEPGDPAIPASTALELDEPVDLALDDGRAVPVLYASEPSRGLVHRFSLADPDLPLTWTTDVLAIDGVAEPTGLAVDAESGHLYVADPAANIVVRVDREGSGAVVVAGRRGLRGFAGDGGSATAALLNEPGHVLFHRVGDRELLFIADAGNQRVRRVDLGSGVITTVLGDGSAASGGEGAPARAFPVFNPRGLAVDAAGNLYVTSGSAIRMVQADTFFEGSEAGMADGADEVATIYGRPPRENFPEGATRCLADVEVIGGEVPLVVDECVGLLFALERQ